jgi:hypothetical protein
MSSYDCNRFFPQHLGNRIIQERIGKFACWKEYEEGVPPNVGDLSASWTRQAGKLLGGCNTPFGAYYTPQSYDFVAWGMQ